MQNGCGGSEGRRENGEAGREGRERKKEGVERMTGPPAQISKRR